MRNKVAKKLKMEVAVAMYVGDDVSEQDVKNDRKSVFASSDFKTVYRARKKNHYKHEVIVNNIPVDNTPEVVLKQMLGARRKKEVFRKRKLGKL